MNDHNKLTNAQLERLVVTMEEMAESIQVMCKVIRHGYDSVNPLGDPMLTNRVLLEKELGHVGFTLNQLINHGDVDDDAVCDSIDNKARTAPKWLHYTQVK